MQQVFHTRQFMAGNSPAVRLPIGMAFPDKTELVVIRDGNRIIVQPQAETLANPSALFAKLGKHQHPQPPEPTQAQRAWQS